MSIAEATALSDILNRVENWPALSRITLARKILESLKKSEPPVRPTKTRGLSAAEIQGMLRTDRPAPDDEIVKAWIDEHHMEKYGR